MACIASIGNNVVLSSLKLEALILTQFTRFLNQQSQTATTTVFDKNLRIQHLDRSSIDNNAHIYDYLRDHVTKDLCDRIEDLKSFETKTIFNVGSCSGLVPKNLNPDKVGAFIQGDISKKSLERARKSNSMLPVSFPIEYIHCDEESIPLKEKSMDLVISSLNLHWVNDLVSCFKQIRNILRDDSPFVGSMFGGDTLYELRSSLQLAELERLSGFSSHVAPKTTGQDVARLLQGCGFQLITVDISELKICYPSMFELMFDLQGMGENNASLFGSRHMHRDVLQASAAIYQAMYGNNDAEHLNIPATFQIIHFIGWKNPRKATPLKSE